MEFVTRADFVTAKTAPRPLESVFVPYFKKHVWCQGVSAREKGQFEESLVRKHQGRRNVDSTRVANARALLAVRCIVQSETDLTRMFTDADAEWIGELPAAVLGPIYDLCQRLSGSSDEEMDELEKLSAEAGSTASASS